MSKEPAVARPASTILLLRDAVAAAEIEVFMMVRHYQIEFASGALVFPGGSVDASDRDMVARPELYAGQGGHDSETLSFRIAAIRETFEESGILLARPKGSGELIAASRAAEIETAHRTALCEGQASFADIVASNHLVLALDLLVPYAHWITPLGLPKRFDTWFFVAKAPPEQLGMHDGKESTDSIWLSPREALAGGDSGRFTLPFPTTRNLVKLGKQPNVAAALDDARDQPVVTVMPVMSKDGDKRFLRIPADAGYDGELFEFSGS
jgi:8-oxo-dGTP pyrophosphatase MutT (NUDIX family)